MKTATWFTLVSLCSLFPLLAKADVAPPFPNQILCETETDQDDLKTTPVCARVVDPEFLSVLKDAYDQLPRIMQIEFRRFHRIYIRRNMSEGNAASVFRIRTRDRSVLWSLNLNINLKTAGGMADYDTNKLLRRFGENHPTFQPTEFNGVDLKIRYRSDGLDDRVFRLKYTLVHEVGHALEGRYAGPSTQFNCEWNKDETAECRLNPASFPAISWDVLHKIGKTAKEDSQEIRMRQPQRFVYLNMFCFFYCEGKPAFLGVNDVERIFSEFRVLPFASLYALANHVEDFAETWTDYWLEKDEGLYQQILFNGEVISDSRLKRDLPAYQRKLRFIQKFANRAEQMQNTVSPK